MPLTCEARTMIELRAKLRKVLGWSDRRTWTAAERKHVTRNFDFRLDWDREMIVATQKESK